MPTFKDGFVAGLPRLVFLLLVLAASVSLNAQTDARYGIAAAKYVMVPMRDGVKLAADIYFPAQNGQPVNDKFPVLLTRTPYNKESAASTADYFVPRGFVVVLQDVRG